MSKFYFMFGILMLNFNALSMRNFLPRRIQRHLSLLVKKTYDSHPMKSSFRLQSAYISAVKDDNLNRTIVDLAHTVLDYIPDKYEGIIITSENLPISEDEFHQRLAYSLKIWKNEGKRGIWMKIPTYSVQFIKPAIDLGFKFHHAVESYSMLTKWLPNSPSTLPPYATHQVGTGSIVSLNGKILVVQENHGILKGKDVWKIPTGLVDLNEDITKASCREVLEETGIHTEFKGIVTFRQSHNVSFGISDLFFLCHLEAKSSNIKIDNKEIKDCTWLDVESFTNQTFFQNSPALGRQASIIVDVVKGRHKHFLTPTEYALGFRTGTNVLYHVQE